MSKQGEEYERFVQDVYKVLNANDGLSNAIVQHDVKLKGISREHQIDVYWQFSYGTVTYRVAVECKDYKNPVTAEKIEAFRSTLLDIGNDIQGIFASRNGFQTGAINVAKTYGIQLMQIREPLESDWDGCIKDISSSGGHVKLKMCRKVELLDKRMMLGVVVTQIVPQMMQFQQLHQH